jgi:hypothetical protein
MELHHFLDEMRGTWFIPKIVCPTCNAYSFHQTQLMKVKRKMNGLRRLLVLLNLLLLRHVKQ